MLRRQCATEAVSYGGGVLSTRLFIEVRPSAWARCRWTGPWVDRGILQTRRGGTHRVGARLKTARQKVTSFAGLSDEAASAAMSLRAILLKRLGLCSRGRGRDHQRWANRYFAGLVLFWLLDARSSEIVSVRHGANHWLKNPDSITDDWDNRLRGQRTSGNMEALTDSFIRPLLRSPRVVESGGLGGDGPWLQQLDE